MVGHVVHWCGQFNRSKCRIDVQFETIEKRIKNQKWWVESGGRGARLVKVCLPHVPGKFVLYGRRKL